MSLGLEVAVMDMQGETQQMTRRRSTTRSRRRAGRVPVEWRPTKTRGRGGRSRKTERRRKGGREKGKEEEKWKKDDRDGDGDLEAGDAAGAAGPLIEVNAPKIY